MALELEPKTLAIANQKTQIPNGRNIDTRVENFRKNTPPQGKPNAGRPECGTNAGFLRGGPNRAGGLCGWGRMLGGGHGSSLCCREDLPMSVVYYRGMAGRARQLRSRRDCGLPLLADVFAFANMPFSDTV